MNKPQNKVDLVDNLLDNTLSNLTSTKNKLIEKTKGMLEEPKIQIDRIKDNDIIVLSTANVSGKSNALENIE